MRTTITIDDDIFKQLEAIAEREGRTRRDVLNTTLRRGIQAARRTPAGIPVFKTGTRDLGRCLILSVDNVAEALAVAEGEDFG